MQFLKTTYWVPNGYIPQYAKLHKKHSAFQEYKRYKIIFIAPRYFIQEKIKSKHNLLSLLQKLRFRPNNSKNRGNVEIYLE